MHVLITGAAGMIGRKLASRLADAGVLGREVARLTLADVVPPLRPQGFSGNADIVTGDFSDAVRAKSLIATMPDVIFHLAAIVSGEAEADFEKGYRINLDGTRHLFEAVREAGTAAPYKPKLVFASSIAVFGAPFSDVIADDFFTTPLTSYGTQKAICELLLSDYTRLGFFEGIGLRLPTICIRPGAPNKAASGFFSSILREPLAGKEAILPVDDSVRHWFASPDAAIGFMQHAVALDNDKIGPRRNLTMPGLSATVAEQIEALRRAGGDKAVKLIRRQPDAAIQKIVSGWPSNFDAARALSLGFKADANFDAIIRSHIEGEMAA